ncbi:MAG: helix-turn-helix domain-containing protein [Patescibacteria group bacterium]
MKNYHISEKVLDQVKAAGLEEKQALIYLSSLKLGGGTITALAKASGVERTGLYYYLDGLVQAGLLKPSTTKKRTIYLPADPDRLLDLVQRREKEVNDVLPFLKSLVADNQAGSQVSYYEGKEGLINLYEDQYSLLKQLDESDNQMLVFARSFEILHALPDYFPGYIEKRKKLSLRTRAILPETERQKGKTVYNDPVTYAKYTQQIEDKRYMPDEFFPHSVIIVFKDYVGMIDYKNYFGSLTHNSVLSETWVRFFEYIWKTLPEEQ